MPKSNWIVWRHAEPKRVLWGMLLAIALAIVVFGALAWLGLTSRWWHVGGVAVVVIVVLSVIPPRKPGT